jgi:hypothetical protein
MLTFGVLAALGAVVVFLLIAAWTVTHSIAVTWRNGSNIVTGTLTQTFDGEDNRSVAMTASEANKRVSVAFTTTNLKSIFIQNTLAAMTLYTNAASGGSPNDTISIPLGVPFIWQASSGIACPFVGNAGAVTDFYFTSSTAVASTVEIRIGKDATP